MKLEKYQEVLKNRLEDCNLSSEATSVIEETIDSLDNVSEDDFSDMLYQNAGDYFIYYSDAYNYLIDNDINDFSDAIDEGYTSVSDIAAYYMMEELNDFDYTIPDDDEEEEEEE